MKVFPITVKIYAEDEQEAERARKALGGFVDRMGEMGVMVTGDRIASGVPKWEKNPLVRSQVIKHFT